MTVVFSGTQPEYNRYYTKEIKFKNIAKTLDLTIGLTVEMTVSFGSYFKDVMSVLTRVSVRLVKLFSGFISSPFHTNSHLLLDLVFTETFFPGMAHSLSLSAITPKKEVL